MSCVPCVPCVPRGFLCLYVTLPFLFFHVDALLASLALFLTIEGVSYMTASLAMLQVTFDPNTGLVASISNKVSGVTSAVTQDWFW